MFDEQKKAVHGNRLHGHPGLRWLLGIIIFLIVFGGGYLLGRFTMYLQFASYSEFTCELHHVNFLPWGSLEIPEDEIPHVTPSVNQ